MTIDEFIKTTDLSDTTLVGFYGGGNFGDELLLEVLSVLFEKRHFTNIAIACREPEKRFAQFHKDYGHEIVDIADMKAFISSLLHHKNIVIGGGGLWGLDVNRKHFALSVMLFLCRWIFRKKVYLLGVGYYNSTNKLGHVSAFFAGKAANAIIARDQETYKNYSKINPYTYRDKDITWYMNFDDLKEEFASQLSELENKLKITRKTIFVTLRRFAATSPNSFTEIMEYTIKNNPEVPFIVMIMEPKEIDPDNYELIAAWKKKNKNIKVIDFDFNPIILYLFFKEHAKHLVYLGPQFHGIITAAINHVPYYPLAYDNKVRELLLQLDPNAEINDINMLKREDVEKFIKNQMGM